MHKSMHMPKMNMCCPRSQARHNILVSKVSTFFGNLQVFLMHRNSDPDIQMLLNEADFKWNQTDFAFGVMAITNEIAGEKLEWEGAALFLLQVLIENIFPFLEDIAMARRKLKAVEPVRFKYI